ncbi:ion channel [Telmatospirillum sp.]|uniref:ion channel n=1 Tax=Telmatospirillum sp. TaxID=2079197 RepID=UPI0028502EA7|nr:ion channel [Telmatospirillum sp.]MDR3437539.1 ion channel [Telmatospirillum sp.]
MDGPVRPNRIMNIDGTTAVIRVNARAAHLGDLYHWLLTTRRSVFAAVLIGSYLGLNSLFALAYLASGNGVENVRPGSFEDAFFFSVQTMATIGYGKMVPISTLANVLVTAEAGVGLFGIAMAAALMFARFTRPTAGIRFSRSMVISKFDGVPTLMFRLANERNDQIHEARLHMVLMRSEKTAEGQSFRRLHDLSLVRSFTPVFSLSWTVMHRVDETSPLFGIACQDLIDSQSEVMVLLSGHHQGFQQEVHARYAYTAEDVVWGAQFADIFRTLPDGRRVIDFAVFDVLLYPEDAVPAALAAEQRS